MPVSPHRVWKKSKVTDSDLDFDFLVPKVSANHSVSGTLCIHINEERKRLDFLLHVPGFSIW